MNRRCTSVEWIAAILLLLLTILTTCYRIAEPAWESGHQGFFLAQHSINARNLHRFGPIRCGFCLVNCYGSRPNDERIRSACGVRSDNPALYNHLMAWLYGLFGDSETASRLPAAVSSIGLVILIYGLGRSLNSSTTGLVAGLFAALVPMRAYYGRVADGAIPCVLLSTLAFFCFARFVGSHSSRWAWMTGGCLVVSVAFGWTGYFACPGLLAGIVIHRRRLQKPFLTGAVVVAVTVGAFLLHLVWAFWCGGRRQLEFLSEKFLERTAFADNPRDLFTQKELLLTLAGRLDRCMTSALVVLAAIGLAGIAFRFMRRRASGLDTLSVMLLAFWLTHVFVLQNQVVIHDFYMLYPSVPFLALAGAAAFEGLTKRLPCSRVSRPALLLGAVALFLSQAAPLLKEYHEFFWPEFIDDVRTARFLNSITAPEEPVFFDTRPRHPRFWYYLDRRIEVVEGVEHLDRLSLRFPAAKHFVLAGNGSAPAELRAYLLGRFRVTQLGQYSIFDLSSQGGCTIEWLDADSLPPSDGAVDSLVLTQTVVSPEMVSLPPTPNLITCFLNAHPELAEDRMRNLQLVCRWRVHEAPLERYRTRVRVVHTCTQKTEVEQIAEPFGGNLPTTEWKRGQIIRQRVEFILPAHMVPGRYRVEVSLLGSHGEVACRTEAPFPTFVVQTYRCAKPLDSLPPSLPTLRSSSGLPMELVGWERRGDDVSTYWRLKRPGEGCYAAQLCFDRDSGPVWWPLGVVSCSEWRPGETFGLQTRLPPGIVTACSLSVVVRGSADVPEEDSVPLGWWKGGPSRSLLARVGTPDQSSRDCCVIGMKPSGAITYDLPEKAATDLIIWWPGNAERPRARMRAWLQKDPMSPRVLLGTIAVRVDRPGACRFHVPAEISAPGGNRVFISLGEEPRSLMSWREWVLRSIPRMKWFVGVRALTHVQNLALDSIEVYRS